jgi:7-carboxy-7-deazaguanine synthase
MQDNTSGQAGSTCIIDIDKFDKREMLNDSLYDFNIETNGTIIPSFHRDNVWFTYDYKTPSSLAEESMNVDIFKVATERDLIKFVVGSPEDLDCMRRIIEQYPTVAQIYVSPVWGQIEPASIIDYMKAYNLQNVRFQLQIHKFVWDPDAKGV